MELCVLCQGTTPGKAADAHSRNRAPARRKEQRVKKIHRLLKEQGKGNVSKAFDPT